MKIMFRHYTSEPFHTKDYVKVREFLTRINADEMRTPRFVWGAWEWAVTHQNRDQTKLDKIGLWEDEGKLVAIATYECGFGEGFLFVDEPYAHLKAELVEYAKEHLHNNGKLKILIPDGDYEFAHVAIKEGFRPTQDTDRNSVLDIGKLQPYKLSEGFSFVSMADGWNWEQYNRVMRRGFGGEENPLWNEGVERTRRLMLSSPMIIPELIVAVANADGSYVSHCGIWYKPGELYCYIEPVVTDPDYQKKGIGKAVVLEAVKRVGELGAKQAWVGSDKQFYYNIGFYPVQTSTYWELTYDIAINYADGETY